MTLMQVAKDRMDVVLDEIRLGTIMRAEKTKWRKLVALHPGRAILLSAFAGLALGLLMHKRAD